MASIVSSIASHIPNPIPDALNPFAGESSPFAGHPKAADPAAPTDLIWLLDNTAAQDAAKTDTWRASFVAAFFAKGSGELGPKTVSHIIEELQKAGLLDKHPENAEQIRNRIEQRVLPFFREVIEGRKVDVRIRTSSQGPGHSASDSQGSAVAEREVGPSDADGVARDEITVSGNFTDGDTTKASAVGVPNHVPAFTTFAAPEGWAVISDIDDTIKVTLTDHVSGILKTTFLDTPKPIDGMPELYWHMNKVLQNPPFWYLSASPYNLYQFLHEFRDQYYPRGTLELRNASWQNVAHFLSSINQGTQDYKVSKMEDRVYKYWPKRKMVCLGDSTQTDPEAYGEMARKRPGWIHKIFIRRVKNVVEVGDGVVPGKSDEERNKPERFEKAFEGLPKELWYVFDGPDEVREQLDALVNTK